MYYSYSAAQWLLVFYLYCMLGWCFESTVVSVGQCRLVNRGFLRGPMLPIYGFGAVILLHVSLPLKQHPVWLYLASMIAATVFEYIVGVVMEKILLPAEIPVSGLYLPALVTVLGLSRPDPDERHSSAD